MEPDLNQIQYSIHNASGLWEKLMMLWMTLKWILIPCVVWGTTRQQNSSSQVFMGVVKTLHREGHDKVSHHQALTEADLQKIKPNTHSPAGVSSRPCRPPVGLTSRRTPLEVRGLPVTTTSTWALQVISSSSRTPRSWSGGPLTRGIK